MAEQNLEQSIFLHAIGLASPTDRAAYLDEACRDNPQLRAELDALLAAHDRLGGAAPPSIQPETTGAFTPPTEAPGAVIGPYKLIEEIGEGGMGTVWMAQQTEPVKRVVALKLIKAGMDSKQVIARFEAERQALALMDHPNIARVLDGGTTPTGRPYFVMDLVKGVPITKYCDEHHLAPRQRLELFVPVCQAVQHAHQKGIIHRDLKPSNVLVALYDGKPVPKVIDFGVAKAAGQPLTEQTLVTGFGNIVGTLEYMSPEQAEINQLDIDTRSDIYSLGVLLYELLTGSPPFTRKELEKAGLLEMLRVIREQEPSKPSTKLSTAEGLPTLAANRGTEPAMLTKLVRGELDWIVMKALEKDRNRRYETANGFAMDVQRYLADEPVQACPPSVGYRLRKFVRRNKGPVLAASLIILALVGGVIGTSWGMVRAIHAEDAARAEAIETDQARKDADRQAATATSIAESLKQMLGLLDPDAHKGPDYTVVQLIDDYADNLEEKLADQPEAAADLHATVGRAYACRGQRDKARKHLARALTLARGVYGDQHEKYADILVDYARPDASPDTSNGRAELAAREADLRQALAIYRAQGVGGERVIKALWTLKLNLLEQKYSGDPKKQDQIEPVLNEALAEAAKWPGIEFQKIPSIYHALAEVRIGQSQFPEAERIARNAVAMHLKLHKDSLETAWGYFILGEALRPQGKFGEALAAEKQALSIMRKGLPSEVPSIAYALNAVNRTLDAASDAHALADVFPSLTGLGEWESLFREVLTTTKPGKLDYADPVNIALNGLARFSGFYLNLGREWAAAGKAQQAEEARRKATSVLESLQSQFAGKPDLLGTVYSSATVALMKAGQPERAKELGRKLLDQVTPKTTGSLNDVAWFLATVEVPAHRDPALAIELAKKAVQSNPRSRSYRNTLGVARYRAGDWKQAIADLKESVALGHGGDSFDGFFLSMAYWKLGASDEAQKWYDLAVHWMDRNQPKNEELRRFRAEAAGLLQIENK